MTALPSGTATFLFSDIEGSTRLVQSRQHRVTSIRHTRAALAPGRCDRIPPHPCWVRRDPPRRRRIAVIRVEDGRERYEWRLPSMSRVLRFRA